MLLFLRRIPIEWYAIVCPAFFMLCGLLIAGNASVFEHVLAFGNYVDWRFVIQLAFGGPVLLTGYALVTIYLCLRTIWPVIEIVHALLANNFHNQKVSHIRSLRRGTISGLFLIFGAISAGIVLIGILIIFIYTHVSADEVAQASEVMANLDVRVFGAYPSLWLASLGLPVFAEVILLQSYLFLGGAVALLFFYLFLFNARLFREFMLAFFFAALISIPFFWMYPAISPQGYYLDNEVRAELPADLVAARAELVQTPYMTNIAAEFRTLWSSPTQSYFAVSTNPSMHVAWCLIVVFVLVRLSRRLIVPASLWFLFLTISTIYSFQHYAIDIPAGIIAGIFGILFAKFALYVEDRYYADIHVYASLFSMLERDAERIRKTAKWILRAELNDILGIARTSRHGQNPRRD